ncbi:MAG: hypothetical protein DRI44_02730 [Chlamydiae bacterium]|nr:MAG: hypothetical protein DRI44_02730 [Chlamydiota bacterium]
MKQPFALWQLPSQSPSQMESYVIKSVNGKIIVIDGGMTCDGAYLKKFLEELGGGVDMWILTHAHCDHIDALAWILSNQGSLEIKEIYASFPPLDWVQKYENHEAFSLENFEIVMKKIGRNYIKTNTGDSFIIDSINIEVLSDINLEITENAINNSSIVLKVSDNTKSFLFLNDLGDIAGDKLLKNIDHEKLKADYVQMAHHGQNGVRKNFYEIIQPKYCLWPTPLWLWNNDVGNGKNSGPWQTLEVRDWMKELNVKENFVSGLSKEPLLFH